MQYKSTLHEAGKGKCFGAESTPRNSVQDSKISNERKRNPKGTKIEYIVEKLGR